MVTFRFFFSSHLVPAPPGGMLGEVAKEKKMAGNGEREEKSATEG